MRWKISLAALRLVFWVGHLGRQETHDGRENERGEPASQRGSTNPGQSSGSLTKLEQETRPPFGTITPKTTTIQITDPNAIDRQQGLPLLRHLPEQGRRRPTEDRVQQPADLPAQGCEQRLKYGHNPYRSPYTCDRATLGSIIERR